MGSTLPPGEINNRCRDKLTPMSGKTTILFLCTHNAARSQMAEGYMRAKYGDQYEVFSAGTKPGTVNPMAIESMNEIGIDISHQRSKSIDEFTGKQIDTVVTLCDSARENCPFFPGMRRIMHESFTDPKELTGTEEEIRTGFRLIRNELTRWIDTTFASKKNR
jgi:arsenate reductase (thioredoxin)